MRVCMCVCVCVCVCESVGRREWGRENVGQRLLYASVGGVHISVLNVELYL